MTISPLQTDMRPRRTLEGVGLGLRGPHIPEILETKPAIPWFEVLTDNHALAESLAFRQLELLRRHYPISMHSVGLSLGSTDELNFDYMRRLRDLRDYFEPVWISEHLAWTSVHGVEFHDLLPLPYTLETVLHLSERIARVQEFLGERILVENVSSYLSYDEQDMTEAEFVREVVERSDCLLLLDINNIYVSAVNHGFDAVAYINAMPCDRVREFHLGGHERRDGYLYDAHNAPVCSDVWELYGIALGRFGPVPTLVEWDNDIPPLGRLIEEMDKAQSVMAEVDGYYGTERATA